MPPQVTREQIAQAFADAWNAESDQEFLYLMDIYFGLEKEKKEQEENAKTIDD